MTGAATGLGRGIAEIFVEEGANVVIADIDLAGAEATAAALGGNTVAVACDVADEASVAAMVDMPRPVFRIEQI